MRSLPSSRTRRSPYRKGILQLSGGKSSKTRFLQLAGWRVYSLCFGKRLFSSLNLGWVFICVYYSEESERVSELKSMSGSSKLPYGTLALGAEGIKDAIRGFDDAYASDFFALFFRTYVHDHTPLLDVNLILKTSDCHLIWSMRIRQRAEHISHLRCPKPRERILNRTKKSHQAASRPH